jgi:hypothetical protein
MKKERVKIKKEEDDRFFYIFYFNLYCVYIKFLIKKRHNKNKKPTCLE